MLKTQKLKLQPHQIRLSEKLRDVQFPLYLYWGMGSGKSIGGILTIAAFLEDGRKGLVICDKSVKTQWSGEVQKFFGDKTDRVVICHYEELDRDDAVDPHDYAVTVVDEAQRFRNAWYIQSQRRTGSSAFTGLRGSPRPHAFVHDPDVEMDASAADARLDDAELAGRVCFYDPRLDEKRIHHYAKVENEPRRVPDELGADLSPAKQAAAVLPASRQGRRAGARLIKQKLVRDHAAFHLQLALSG